MNSNHKSSDQDSCHRDMAMQSNNRAWALTTLPRTLAGDLEMLHAAHASAYH